MATRTEPLTDAELIEALKGARTADAALRQLYRQHYEGLEGYVLSNNGSAADAEDLFQEALVALVNLVRSGKFRGESSLKTLLYALNRNLWLNELKRRGRAQAREERYEAGQEQVTQACQLALEQREVSGRLQQLLDELGQNCREILMGFYYENQSIRELLARLPYENEQVVRNKKGKCLKKLEGMVRGNERLYQQLKQFLHG